MATSPKIVARIESEEPTLKLAVLIDADNAQAVIIEGLLAEIATFGEATVKRIYGDFTSTSSAQWKKVLQTYAIKPIQQFAYTAGKNATDSSLIIDAMDLLYTRRFDGFCLISSDSDFTGLALRIREEGLLVLGFGEKKTPEAFRNACHKFIFTEVLRPEPPAAALPPPPAAVPPPPPAAALPPPPAAVPAPQASSTPAETPAPARSGPVGTTPASVRNSADTQLPTAFILDALGSSATDEAGWVNLATFGSYLTKLKPDFDPRLYGHKKLSDMLRVLSGVVEIEERQASGSASKVLYIRRRTSP